MGGAVLMAAVLLGGLPLTGAELEIDFGQFKAGEAPKGFRSAVSGQGQPGDWRVVYEDLPAAAEGNAVKASVTPQRAVLAQLARDTTDEHFPLLIREEGRFDDFTFSARFKTVEGAVEQMAGLAFRIQDEKNYYVLRASSLGKSFWFYKFVEGVRAPPVGVAADIPRGEWHEMTVQCKGNQIRCLLDGKELFPPLIDNSFAQGRIGFWTKSDSVSYFTAARVVFTPKETLARMLVRQTLEDYPRLLGLRICAPTGPDAEVQVVASSDAAELGRPAGTVDRDVASNGNVYYGKDKDEVIVTLPLHDRNGDPAAAVRVVMKSFPGQTQDNALARARPIVKQMERRVRSAKDLTE
jgi:hypothetical protein